MAINEKLFEDAIDPPCENLDEINMIWNTFLDWLGKATTVEWPSNVGISTDFMFEY